MSKVETAGLNIRQRSELLEEELFSSYAQLSKNSRGRLKKIPDCPLRTCYQRDRDRVIHSKAFRRLMHKTQVFLAPEGDHYRTRLTHTLEVAQISRTVALALRLNEDLTESVALAHDLGHTPFGHVGEDALTEIYDQIRDKYPALPKRYRHNIQSLRIVDHLEYDGAGLNLTFEVRDGIAHHTGAELPMTLEGQIVKIADRVAYINHDIDDAIRAGILDMSDLPKNAIKILGDRYSSRINNMVNDLITGSEDSSVIKMTPRFEKAMGELRTFLFKKIYQSALSPAKSEDEKAKNIIKTLFWFYMDEPSELPQEFRPRKKAELPVKITDYVSGMTDRYAIRKFEELFVPSPWQDR